MPSEWRQEMEQRREALLRLLASNVSASQAGPLVGDYLSQLDAHEQMLAERRARQNELIGGITDALLASATNPEQPYTQDQADVLLDTLMSSFNVREGGRVDERLQGVVGSLFPEGESTAIGQDVYSPLAPTPIDAEDVANIDRVVSQAVAQGRDRQQTLNQLINSLPIPQVEGGEIDPLTGQPSLVPDPAISGMVTQVFESSWAKWAGRGIGSRPLYGTAGATAPSPVPVPATAVPYGTPIDERPNDYLVGYGRVPITHTRPTYNPGYLG